ncbi:hypothetical protein [Promicromonospora soli]
MTDSRQDPASRPPLAGLFLYLAGVATDAVAVELGSSIVLRLLAPVLVVLGVAIVARAGGPFHRGRIREARWKLWTAWLATAVLLGAYLTLTVRASQADGFWITFLTAACLTTAATIALHTTLTTRPGLDRILMSLATPLVGVATLLLSVAELTSGQWLYGIAGLLAGVMFLLLGVAALTYGTLLLCGACLSGGVALLLYGAVAFTHGTPLLGAALLVSSVAVLLLGVVFLTGRTRLFGVALLLAGVAFLLVGADPLTNGHLVIGVAGLLSGVATLLIVVAVVRYGAAAETDGRLLFSAGILLTGVATLLTGVDALLLGKLLLGVAGLVLGIASLTIVRRLRGRPCRVLAHLRAPAPPVDDDGDGNDRD